MFTICMEDLWFRYSGTKKYILESFYWKRDTPGTIGLIGTNGCGKTTLLKLITGSLSPTKGNLWIKNDKKSKIIRKEEVVYVPENAKLFLVGPSPRKDLKRIIKEQRHVDMLLEQYKFSTLADKKLYHLSEGQRRLFALFFAFQVPSSLILLDEPTIGLDSSGRGLLFHLLEQAKHQGKMVIVSTNDSRIFSNLDELIVLKDGTLSLCGSPLTVLYELEKNTDLIPNQTIRLIMALERTTGRELPHCLTSEELNEVLADRRLF